MKPFYLYLRWVYQIIGLTLTKELPELIDKYLKQKNILHFIYKLFHPLDQDYCLGLLSPKVGVFK